MLLKTNLKYQISGFLLMLITGICFGQGEKKYIRQGNGKYNDNKFSESEVSYRKALDKNKMSSDAGFNLGDALYKQNKYEDAGKQFLENSSISADNIKKSNSLYNLGNSLLNDKKIQESIDIYKNSLKLNPGNNEAKYNLAYAQDLLKQQQQQKQQKEQNKEDNKDNKKNEKNKDQDKKQDENKNQNQNQDQKNDQQQQQGISKEDAQRLLNALANDEKNVQEKVKLAKAAKARVKVLKNW
jgi:Ca-activated chloride channel family protein